MFESEVKRDDRSVNLKRRALLVTSASAVAGLAFWSLRKPQLVRAIESQQTPKPVAIVQFSDAGERLKTVQAPKMVKTEDEWRRQLPAGVFDITRHADTEIAFTGKYWNLHDQGLYRCICCDNALFSSETKFDSGTGWPSFWAPIAPENVRSTTDTSYGMVRTAVSCTECDAHMGHVFDDGPEPTHLRYCMNSASLRFVAHKTA